jgi:hypothetical protein
MPSGHIFSGLVSEQHRERRSERRVHLSEAAEILGVSKDAVILSRELRRTPYRRSSHLRLIAPVLCARDVQEGRVVDRDYANFREHLF